jgi:hypothetical protein
MLAVLVVFPVGLFLMWTRSPGWGRRTNAIVTGLVGAAAVLGLVAILRSPLVAPPGPSAVVTSPNPSSSATAPPPSGSSSATPSPTLHQSTPPPVAPPPGTPAPAPAGFRNPLAWPFASTSIWNTPIGRSAVYVPAGIAPATARTVSTDQDVVVMQPTAPLTPIQYNGAAWSGGSRCAGGATLAAAPIPPSLVVPSGKGNFSFAILMPDGHTVVQGQPMARCSAGGPVTSFHVSPPADLFGAGTLGAHGGSGLSSLGGTIRLGELMPGAAPIRHALKVNLDGAADYWPVGFRWPAIKEDGYGPQRYGGKVPSLKMGALLALPASLNLASLNLQSGPGRMIAWTLQNYGAYCVDDAARSVYSIATELGPAGAVTSQFQQAWGYSFVSGVGDTPWARDIATIFAHLAVVDNNSALTVGGAGPRLQPTAPPFTAALAASTATTGWATATFADLAAAPAPAVLLALGLASAPRLRRRPLRASPWRRQRPRGRHPRARPWEHRRRDPSPP